MELNVLNIISLITTFQAILFSIYLLSNNPKQNPSNYFIAIFLIVYAIDFAAFFNYYYLYPVAPNLSMLLSMTLFLAPPSLFLYVKSSLYSDFKLKKEDILHLLPLVLINLLFIPFYYLPNISLKLAPSNYQTIFFELVIPINYLILHIQSITYLIASYIILKRYKKLYLENFSNADTKKYRYLLQLIVILAISDIISSIKNYALFNYEGDLYDYSLHIVNFMALIMVCWIVFKALRSPELFTGINSNLKPVRDIIKDNKKNTTSIDKIEADPPNKLIQKLKAYMYESTPYLDASLSLEGLAKQLDFASKELSVLINHTMGLHFFDFVNEYRIEHAKNLLVDKSQNDLTVLEILYEVGFNSKSSFNTEFKKRTGSTPTEYRRNHL